MSRVCLNYGIKKASEAVSRFRGGGLLRLVSRACWGPGRRQLLRERQVLAMSALHGRCSASKPSPIVLHKEISVVFLKTMVIAYHEFLWKETAMIKLMFMENGYSPSPSPPRNLKRVSLCVSSAQWTIHCTREYTQQLTAAILPLSLSVLSR